MNFILFDHHEIRQSLLPLTFTRPTANLRLGTFTIIEKWEKILDLKASYFSDESLQSLFPLKIEEDNLLVNGALCPSQDVAETILDLKMGEALYFQETLIAVRANKKALLSFDRINVPKDVSIKNYQKELLLIRNTFELFQNNGDQIRVDFKALSDGRKSQKIEDKHTAIYGEENIFIEENVKIRAAIINAEKGPVYIGKNATIEEGAILRGPLSIGENVTVNMGAKIRENTTIGPFCKVGGEINNVIFWGYSNKGHDGFLGNSVIGQWCNLGADTNCSNLKNNYSNVKVWSYAKDKNIDTGQQFCGLVMGDHSKAGINTMFNTGTVVGVAANVFGAGFPNKFIPSFTWGGLDKNDTFGFDKMLEVATKVMERRGEKLSDQEVKLYKEILVSTKKYRTWEDN